ncbi:hypothetical protein P691DRAFT_801349 [Macrolepiota fuliginosa MF-IS2]|uniref:Uncharacterized protein n=1 Tax=Macrolepiota fuliginosa MF-IS2 TaxID=1400762 RepID=A0A9P5XB25_9AGAR|nr:hypothetical protein P691DRAFT_801349 [Macrolepiota fuliginosa MF-IS2]
MGDMIIDEVRELRENSPETKVEIWGQYEPKMCAIIEVKLPNGCAWLYCLPLQSGSKTVSS